MCDQRETFTEMSLGEHLEELRRRIVWALAGVGITMAITLVFGKWLLGVLCWPYVKAMNEMGRPTQFLALRAEAGFLLYLKVSLLGGLILASPWVFYQIWQFVAAGLYRRERRTIQLATPFCAGLFASGAAFYLFVVAAPMLHVLVAFNDYLGLQTCLTMENHVGMMVDMMLVFGLAFQLPVAVVLLGKVGIVTTRSLGRYRRHVIVGLLIVAALLTSPSPVDQVLLAVPMWLLFELGVFLVWLDERKKSQR